MSENLKDLIDKAEEEEKTRAQLEKTVESLELKVAKLETKLKEKQKEPEFAIEQPVSEDSESEEIKILKNLINSQNQELTQRNREKEALHMKIKDLNTELTNLKESINDSIKDQVIMKTQNSLNTLIEDYGRLENMNRTLKQKILEIEAENEGLRDNVKSFETETSNVEELEYKMSRLNKQLNDLREENKMLEDSNLTLQNRELSVDNLEKTLRNLESINSELKNENQKLITKLDTVKAERFQLTKFEAKASNLEKEIQTLRKENEELRQKDAILLAKTINIMETHKNEPIKIQRSPEPIEEVASLTREKKPDLEPKPVYEPTPKPELEPVYEAAPKLEPIYIPAPQPTLQAAEPSLENEMQKEEAVTRKKVCPNCGNANNAFIREFDDKTKIIYTYPRIYAKMYRCGQCGTEWR